MKKIYTKGLYAIIQKDTLLIIFIFIYISINLNNNCLKVWKLYRAQKLAEAFICLRTALGIIPN